MENLRQWLTKNEASFILLANSIIGVLASVFILVNLYKLMKALKDGNMGDAAKNFVYAALIAVVALIGIMGVRNFVSRNKIGNDLIEYGTQ